MGPEAEGDGRLEEERYWRRRAAVLAGVLGAVAFVGWACSASGGDGPGAGTDDAGATALPPGAAVPPAVPTVTVTAKVTRTATPSPAAERRDGCAPGAVVVTLTPDSGAYGPGGRPVFRITAVNTGAEPCRFDVGRDHLDLRITSGQDRVWSSSECAPGPRSRLRTLRRGVPYVDVVTWDRRRCTGDRARPGTYVASLHSDTARVPRRVFRLS